MATTALFTAETLPGISDAAEPPAPRRRGRPPGHASGSKRNVSSGKIGRGKFKKITVENPPFRGSPGDLVWAKFEGFPYWPAYVLERDCSEAAFFVVGWMRYCGFVDRSGPFPPVRLPSIELLVVFGQIPSNNRADSEHLCRFFGTYDVAWVAETRVLPFDTPQFDDLSKQCRMKSFRQVILTVREFPSASLVADKQS